MFFNLEVYENSQALEKKQINEILELDEIARDYNLVITPEKAKYIVDSNKSALNDMGRIEFGESIAKKMTRKFCSSSFVSKHNIEKVVGEMLEIFYYAKNETNDSIKDDKLIEIMFNGFDGECKGSAELLFDWVISEIIHEYNYRDLFEPINVADKDEDEED